MDKKSRKKEKKTNVYLTFAADIARTIASSWEPKQICVFFQKIELKTRKLKQVTCLNLKLIDKNSETFGRLLETGPIPE